MCKRILASQTNTEDGVPFYKIGTIGSTPDAYISKELFDDYKVKYSYPHKGEVMITCAGTVGKCVVYDGEDAYFQDSNIVWIDNPTQNISNGFLFHLLSKVDWRKLNSTTIIRIYNDDLRNLKMSYPQKEEQQKISHLLSLLDERITTQNKIIEDLKKLKSAIIESHYNQTEKQTVFIADLGEPFNVGNLSKDDLSETGNPCIIYGELFTTYGETISQIESHTNKKEGMTLSKKGDLLFPTSTTVDAISLIAPSVINVDGVILGGDMFGIHISTNFNAQYLSYYFNHIAKRQLAKFAKGSTIIHLHYTDIEKARLLLPSLEEQNKMANCLISLDEKIRVEKSYLQLLDKQKAYLLRQMFI
ncbi:Type I restriction modification DNA specificity domain protein [Bacteroides salyersiae]|uniref:restriction endonuclease subunit S n=1 Tax=Bacteroides salyersiae TaxID=291644 RepID=UPI001B8BA57A|nr:Type I restriction modification DNA specificity domain protein [Bacteroides salyersiae]